MINDVLRSAGGMVDQNARGIYLYTDKNYWRDSCLRLRRKLRGDVSSLLSSHKTGIHIFAVL